MGFFKVIHVYIYIYMYTSYVLFLRDLDMCLQGGGFVGVCSIYRLDGARVQGPVGSALAYILRFAYRAPKSNLAP